VRVFACACVRACVRMHVRARARVRSDGGSAGGWDGSRALEFVEEYDAFADRCA